MCSKRACMHYLHSAKHVSNDPLCTCLLDSIVNRELHVRSSICNTVLVNACFLSPEKEEGKRLRKEARDEDSATERVNKVYIIRYMMN